AAGVHRAGEALADSRDVRGACDNGERAGVEYSAGDPSRRPGGAAEETGLRGPVAGGTAASGGRRPPVRRRMRTMHDETGHRGGGGGGGRRLIVTDFPPALVKQVAGVVRRILQEVPPGTNKPRYSPALTKHVVRTFADIVLHSVERAQAHSTPRPKRGR